MILRPNGNENPEDGWAGARIMLANPSKFLGLLKNYGDRIAKVTEK
jgi:hypothetical protein